MNKGHEKDGKAGTRRSSSPQVKRQEESGDNVEAVSGSTSNKVEKSSAKRSHGGVDTQGYSLAKGNPAKAGNRLSRDKKQ